MNSLYAVVGYDYENADMDNPRGEIVREVFHLTAVNDFGDRWTWGSFESFEAAEAAIPNAPPIMFWEDSYPVYGSPAYEAYGMDTEFNYNDLVAATSVEIADIVYDVTDELGRNRFERHAKTYPKTAANPKAILVKLADRIANTRHSRMGETRFFKMYRREYPAFREALYNEEYFVEYPAMKMLWKILDEETWK